MRILLLRPYPETAQFGLSPFFQTEPLGLMYLAAALRQKGNRRRQRAAHDSAAPIGRRKRPFAIAKFAEDGDSAASPVSAALPWHGKRGVDRRPFS